jgi:hypothetical protein
MTMGHACAVVTLVGLLGVAEPPTLPDLAKVDRTIAKEPAYQAAPRYCLIAFGPRADSRVWLVRDSDGWNGIDLADPTFEIKVED